MISIVRQINQPIRSSDCYKFIHSLNSIINL